MDIYFLCVFFSYLDIAEGKRVQNKDRTPPKVSITLNLLDLVNLSIYLKDQDKKHINRLRNKSKVLYYLISSTTKFFFFLISSSHLFDVLTLKDEH